MARRREVRRSAVRPLVPGWLLLVLITLLAVTTWTAGDPEFRVVRAPGGLIDEARTAEAAGWVKRGEAGTLRVEPDGGAVLANGGDRAVIFRLIELPAAGIEDGETLRLLGRFERLGAATFTLDKYMRTMVFLRWLDVRGETLGYGAVTRFSGQFRTRSFEIITAPPPGAVAAELVMRAKIPGAWRLDDITLDVVRPAPNYALVRAALIVAWAVVLGLFVLSTMHAARGRSAIFLGCVLAVLVTGVTLSQAGVEAAVVPVSAALAAWLPDVATPSAGLMLEGGHAFGFGMLVLALLAVRRSLGLNVVGVLLLGLAFAFATEALQRHRPNRSPELGDIAVDSIGMLIALLAWAAHALYEQRQRRKARVAGAEVFLPSGSGRRRRRRSASPPDASSS